MLFYLYERKIINNYNQDFFFSQTGYIPVFFPPQLICDYARNLSMLTNFWIISSYIYKKKICNQGWNKFPSLKPKIQGLKAENKKLRQEPRIRIEEHMTFLNYRLVRFKSAVDKISFNQSIISKMHNSTDISVVSQNQIV